MVQGGVTWQGREAQAVVLSGRPKVLARVVLREAVPAGHRHVPPRGHREPRRARGGHLNIRTSSVFFFYLRLRRLDFFDARLAALTERLRRRDNRLRSAFKIDSSKARSMSP